MIEINVNIKVYHGCEKSSVDSIIKNGFYKNSISCATMNKDWAAGYGDSLISFKYPYKLYFFTGNFLLDLFYLIKFIKNYIKKEIPVCVSGFKPIKINQNENKRR